MAALLRMMLDSMLSRIDLSGCRTGHIAVVHEETARTKTKTIDVLPADSVKVQL